MVEWLVMKYRRKTQIEWWTKTKHCMAQAMGWNWLIGSLPSLNLAFKKIKELQAMDSCILLRSNWLSLGEKFAVLDTKLESCNRFRYS